MDLMLTRNGDLMLQETVHEDTQIALNFIISNTGKAIALSFDFENFTESAYDLNHGLILNLAFEKQNIFYTCPELTGYAEIEQLCYNAIRTKLSSVKSALDFGSKLYEYANHKITKDALKQIEYYAREAILEYVADPIVKAELKATRRGECKIVFNIEMMSYKLNIDFIF